MTPEILYREGGVIVCLKPGGVLCEGGQGENMLSLLGALTGSEIYPVHRLDRETAGVMAFAESSAAAAFLSKQISSGELKKSYFAVTAQGIDPEEGEMNDLLFRDSAKNKSYVVKRERRGVRKASLEYSLKAQNEGLYLWRVNLRTGRTHQIRAQFASRGAPLYGDTRYGAKQKDGFGLFAYSLTLKLPSSAEQREFAVMPKLTEQPFCNFGEWLK